jgi:hypothetical protein
LSRIIAVLAVLLVAVAAVGLYHFKDRSAERAQEVRSLRAQIAEERERIGLLTAEWNYLNQPDRIQELSKRHLDLERLDARQIGTVESLPMRPVEIDPFEGDALVAPRRGEAGQ